MPELPTHLIDSILEPKGDALDGQRAATAAALEGGVPDARKQVFDLANQCWMPIATAAWNEGERSSEIFSVCSDVQRLCEWVYETPRQDDEDRFDTGGAVTTAGMMLYVLGDTDGAIERFRSIIQRPVNSYFHESTHEKLISTLVKEDRTDEAVEAIDDLLGQYPHNTFGNNCKEAYEAQLAGSAAGAEATGTKIDMDAYTQVTTALSHQFSEDMERLVAEGLPPAEMQVRMNDAQKAFQSAMELVSRLI